MPTWPPTAAELVARLARGELRIPWEVPVTLERDGRRLSVLVGADCVALDTPEGPFRVTCDQAAAQALATAAGRLLLAPGIVDAYGRAATRSPPIHNQPIATMMTEQAWRTYERAVIGDGGAWSPWELTRGVGKDYVLARGLVEKMDAGEGVRCAIYGWHRPDGSIVQDLSTAHSVLYWDYSHKVRLCARAAELDGRPIDLATVYADPELARLVTPYGRPGPIPSRWPNA